VQRLGVVFICGEHADVERALDRHGGVAAFAGARTPRPSGAAWCSSSGT
jgi:hypothetical protein